MYSGQRDEAAWFDKARRRAFHPPRARDQSGHAATLVSQAAARSSIVTGPSPAGGPSPPVASEVSWSDGSGDVRLSNDRLAVTRIRTSSVFIQVDKSCALSAFAQSWPRHDALMVREQPGDHRFGQRIFHHHAAASADRHHAASMLLLRSCRDRSGLIAARDHAECRAHPPCGISVNCHVHRGMIVWNGRAVERSGLSSSENRAVIAMAIPDLY